MSGAYFVYFSKICKNVDIGFLTPERDAPIYSLVIPKISARYCEYLRNKLVECNYSLDR